MYGLSQNDWNFIKEILLTPLTQAGCELYIFGSRARGDYKKFSDLDILIECDQDMSDALSTIQEKLEESSLPIKVDLVLSQYCAESYRESIDKDKIALQ